MIDVHTHIFDEASYQGYKKKANGRVEKIITLHYRYHVTLDASPNPLSLDELLSFAKTKNDLAVVASADLEGEPAPQLEILEELLKKGTIVGLKIYPGYQSVYASDKKAMLFAQLCAKYQRPLIIHTGDVDGNDPGDSVLLKYAQPLHVDELAVLVPECAIIIAHFGFPYILEAGNVIAKNKNVYADISATLNDLGTEENNRNNLEAYMWDLTHTLAYFPIVRPKILFGTDYAGEHTEQRLFENYIDLVEKVFTLEERGRVYSGLAKELFHL